MTDDLPRIEIEIWKAKPSWHRVHPNERQAMIQRLALLVRPDLYGGMQEENGPFLIQERQGDVLVWATETNGRETTLKYTEVALNEHFELLAYVSVTNQLSATAWLKKLSA